MEEKTRFSPSDDIHTKPHFLPGLLLLTAYYFIVEVFSFFFYGTAEIQVLAFGALWALMLGCITMCLPRKAGRIVFGIVYYLCLLWSLAQMGYYQVFGKLMWLSSALLAGEGAHFIGDVLRSFSLLWWIGGAVLILAGVPVLRFFPKAERSRVRRFFCLAVAAMSAAGLFVLPKLVFLRDNSIWGTHTEYARSSSYRATYETMYDAQRVYNICGIYQLTFRDFCVNVVYPLTPSYRAAQEKQIDEIDSYFAARPASGSNEMTGVLAGKNVIFVLMESMDDWMITQEETPTLCRLMDEGINFAEFYSPGYGAVRTFNTEFCANTGIYLPTTGNYVFDYVTNHYSESLAAQLTENGYDAQVFHYNSPSFYSRGVFEPAMGYAAYNCYADFTSDQNALYDDCLLFDNEQLNSLFFRDGQRLNTIITRSAHLSYKYNEVLSIWALSQYPEYRGLYGSEEEDCARVKAKVVDDMFARLLDELAAHGELQNTVIVGYTDHYTYGYENMDELYALSGVDDPLLLEKTPCFIWYKGCIPTRIEKTLNTADLLPTLLNMLGIDPACGYLGQDAFDPAYEGYTLFPDGSWATQGIVCRAKDNAIIQNKYDLPVTDAMYAEMEQRSQAYIRISNILLTSDYYKKR